MFIYRVRHKETGLFSTGGMDPTFNKTGKVWKKLNHVRSHLTQFKGPYDYCRKKYPTYLDSVEIVEYVVSETESKVIPLSGK